MSHEQIILVHGKMCHYRGSAQGTPRVGTSEALLDLGCSGRFGEEMHLSVVQGMNWAQINLVSKFKAEKNTLSREVNYTD